MIDFTADEYSDGCSIFLLIVFVKGSPEQRKQVAPQQTNQLPEWKIPVATILGIFVGVGLYWLFKKCKKHSKKR